MTGGVVKNEMPRLDSFLENSRTIDFKDVCGDGVHIPMILEQRRIESGFLTSLFIIFMQLHFWIANTYFDEYVFFVLFRNVCFALALLCVLIKYAVGGRVRLKNVIFVLIALGLCLYSYYISKGQTALKLLLFALMLRDAELKSVVRTELGICMVISAVTIISALVGIIDNRIVIAGTKNRYALGFVNPNIAALILAFQIACYHYIKYDTYNFFNFVIELAGLVLISVATHSRSAGIFLICILMLTFIDKHVFSLSRLLNALIFKILLFMSFPLCTLLSYFVAVSYATNTVIQKLNIVFSWRFSLWYWYTSKLSLHLFGQYIDTEKLGLGTLDNSYLVLLFRYGILVWLLYAITFFLIAKWALYMKDGTMLAFIIAYEVYMLTEGPPVIVNVNLALMFFCTVFWRNIRNTTKEGYKCDRQCSCTCV